MQFWSEKIPQNYFLRTISWIPRESWLHHLNNCRSKKERERRQWPWAIWDFCAKKGADYGDCVRQKLSLLLLWSSARFAKKAACWLLRCLQVAGRCNWKNRNVLANAMQCSQVDSNGNKLLVSLPAHCVIVLLIDHCIVMQPLFKLNANKWMLNLLLAACVLHVRSSSVVIFTRA